MAFLPLDGYLKIRRPATSEERLGQLPVGSWRPTVFVAATQRFQAEQGLTVVVSSNPADLPPLGDNGRYKYSRFDAGEYPYARGRLQMGEALCVSVVLSGNHVVGYAIGEIPGGTAA